MRRRDLAYSIDRHLDEFGTTLEPLTRALLAAARETICLEPGMRDGRGCSAALAAPQAPEKPARVFVHEMLKGAFVAYVDGEAEVIWISDRTPDDRFYQMTPWPVPERIEREVASANIGRLEDDSAAPARAARLGADSRGEPHLRIVRVDSESGEVAAPVSSAEE